MKSKFFTKETISDLGMIPGREFPVFKAGDTIRVTTRVLEGDKERLQDFEGIVIRIKGTGASKTFSVRKISEGIAVEKIIPFHSPLITKIVRLKIGIVRRARIYYLRKLFGRKATVETEK